jgi:outer membrane protein
MKKILCTIVLVMVVCFNQVYAQKTLSLEDSKKLALQNNAKMKNSRLEEDAAGQTRKAALTKYFPNISANGVIFGASKSLMEIESKGGNLPVYDGNLANLSSASTYAYFPPSTTEMLKKGTIGFITVTQPVFAGGRIISGNQLAALGEEVSSDKRKLSEDEISLKTEEQYWQVVSLDEKLITIHKYEDLLRSLLRQVEDAFRSGVVMKNDVLKVKLKLSEVLLNKSKLENGKKLASMALCQYIGVPYDSALIFNDHLDVKGIPQSYYVDNNEALKNRTEYNLLKKSVEAEELQTHLKLGEYLPQVAVGVSGTYMKLDDSKDRTLGMVFGTVSIPISDWWEASHTMKERSLKEEMAQNDYKDKSELLILQMEKAWQDLSDSYKQVMLSEESKAQAEENMKVNDDSYKNGLSDVSDLLEAQAMLQQTKDQLTDSKANYRSKLINYLINTGRKN